MADKLNWQREESIAVPSGDLERRMAIRRADWARLKRCLEAAKPNRLPLQALSAILAGIAVSAGLSIVPLKESEGLADWVLPLYICVTIFGGLIAVVFFVLDRELSRDKSEAIKDVIADMAEIEDMFEAEARARDESFVTVAEQSVLRPTFAPGERVRHPRFGVGVVVTTRPVQNDQEVTIAFAGDVGIKRLMLSYAPLHRLTESERVAT